jgi:hypothetical protein
MTHTRVQAAARSQRHDRHGSTRDQHDTPHTQQLTSQPPARGKETPECLLENLVDWDEL